MIDIVGFTVGDRAEGKDGSALRHDEEKRNRENQVKNAHGSKMSFLFFFSNNFKFLFKFFHWIAYSYKRNQMISCRFIDDINSRNWIINQFTQLDHFISLFFLFLFSSLCFRSFSCALIALTDFQVFLIWFSLFFFFFFFFFFFCVCVCVCVYACACVCMCSLLILFFPCK